MHLLTLTSLPLPSLPHSPMASTRSLAALAHARPSTAPCIRLSAARIASSVPVATFITSSRRSATPSGPPPKNFRLPRERRWDESKEHVLDKAGKYFLLTEMLRGMYVVMEQFFRPPYVGALATLPPVDTALTLTTDIRYYTPSRKVPSHRASEANTRYEGILQARSGA